MMAALQLSETQVSDAKKNPKGGWKVRKKKKRKTASETLLLGIGIIYIQTGLLKNTILMYLIICFPKLQQTKTQEGRKY